MTPEGPYAPLIGCDSCGRLQRHERAGSANVAEMDWGGVPGVPVETGQVVRVEMWRCKVCGGERGYGISVA